MYANYAQRKNAQNTPQKYTVVKEKNCNFYELK